MCLSEYLKITPEKGKGKKLKCLFFMLCSMLSFYSWSSPEKDPDASGDSMTITNNTDWEAAKAQFFSAFGYEEFDESNSLGLLKKALFKEGGMQSCQTFQEQKGLQKERCRFRSDK